MLGIGMGIGMFSSANAAAAQNAGANDPQHVICVRCKFCATVLAVNVPLNSMMEIVSVTCGHCTRLLSVDMSGAFDYFNAGSGHAASFTHNQSSSRASSSSLRSTTQFPIAAATELTEKSATTARGLADGGGGGAEKRQRVPSAYNQFIREEIQRIKAANPGISHKEAFSAAAKNWAHLGLMVSDDKKTETASSSASAPAATC